MKFIHTADWHLGQLFHEYDRTFEHQQFLNWLESLIAQEQTDVLLISGDIFDLSNPSAASVKMFYTFLNRAIKANPTIQIVITAGNHDSPSRLESPKPLLESSNIHIIGMVEKDQDGNLSYEKLIVPLKNSNGEKKILCLAVPFLRMGEYPVITECNDPYAEGVAELYKQVYEAALLVKEPEQAIIAMGHLHASGSEKSADDEQERPIMGGIECIAASAFPKGLAYVALGHIHKAQRVGGTDHIRYCGSPIPMSFSEINYKHQVISFDMINAVVENLSALEIPLSIPLLKVPAIHKPLHEVIAAINELPEALVETTNRPYLEARVILDGPEPGLRYKIETALKGKQARLAKIDVRYPPKLADENEDLMINKKLEEIKPVEVFKSVYQTRFNAPVPETLLALFENVTQEASQEEDK